MLAVCTMLLFGSIIAGLSVRLLVIFLYWLARAKPAVEHTPSNTQEMISVKPDESIVIDEPRLQNSYMRGLEYMVSISVWAFFLNLMQPVVTTILWLQGYQLIEENIFSLSTIQATVSMIQWIAYFAVAVFLILISWAHWNYWRYGLLDHRKPKPLVSNSELAQFFGVSLTNVQEAQ